MVYAVKSLARRGLNKCRRWLSEDNINKELEEERNRFHNFAYGDLNCKLLTLLSDGGGRIRPNYAWGVIHGAYLAKTLGYSRISVVEFGVAGGNGLVSLEETATKVEQLFGIAIDVYGLDTGAGLPAPTDCRDMPNIYASGTYQMDVDRLRGRLTKAKLILGPIRETLPGFLASGPAPIAFFAVDVDLYSSSVDVLKLLEADERLLLPRVHCYFDDIMGCSCSEFLGERLAVDEFNQTHPRAKISPIFGLWHYVPRRFSSDLWPHMIYMAHNFDHSRYAEHDGMVTLKSENLRVAGC